MPIHRLSRGGTKQIHAAVEDLFENLKLRALGPAALKGKRLYVAFRRDLSIPGIFEVAAREEGVRPDLDLLDSLTRVASNYIDATKERAKAKVTNSIDSWLRQQSTATKVDPEAMREKLRTHLDDVWKEMATHVEAIVDTEASNARNVSLMDGIVRINAVRGIDDPVVYFVVVRDNVTCEECIKLHLLEDKRTPRVWRLSEVGQGYHKRGDDNPKIGGLHPHCRCTMVTLLPGFGFKDDGTLGFIAVGHDEFEKQREMEKSERLGPGVNAQGATDALHQVLPESDDLRRKPYQGHENPHAGHCYVASESLYHLLGGRKKGWVPQFVEHEGHPHWYLRNERTGDIADPTAKQFKTPVPYNFGIGKGFLTKEPSKRAQAMIDRMKAKAASLR